MNFNLPTLAMRLTEENFPIAVACLAGGFASLPPSEWLGGYLVINEWASHTCKNNEKSIFTLKNSWYTLEEFSKKYLCDRWVNGREQTSGVFQPDTEFFTVIRRG